MVELEGFLFFGNSNAILQYARELFKSSGGGGGGGGGGANTPPPRYLVIGFTFVLGIDASAADTILQVSAVAAERGCEVRVDGPLILLH